MKRMTFKTNYTVALAIAGMLAFSPAIADKPSWAGGDKGGKNEHREQSDHNNKRKHDGGGAQRGNSEHKESKQDHFDDRHRTYTRDYYGEQFRSGHCPPGLAKKHNGCMPPGHAKKWKVGRPLPREVIYYHVPPALIVQFGPPQAGYRYVRVASDILLIAIGTGMVIDAIQDLGRM